MNRRSLRVAVIHDWLTGMRGGEKVLEGILELFPNATLFSLLRFPKTLSPFLASFPCEVSLLQHIPGIQKNYRYFLPILPKIIEQFRLDGFDLILSSSHCVAKGIRKPNHAYHISYIHAPMRYIWSRYSDYFSKETTSFPVRFAVACIRKPLQKWDQRTSTPSHIHQIIANSHFIAKEIQDVYHRPAKVIYPFVSSEAFHYPRNPKDFYLIVSALVPYKKIQIAIDAFSELRLPLMIIGTGPEEEKLKKNAASNIQFLGYQEDVFQYYAQCKALIFPGIEDFGITPLEAMAAGAPIIAFQQGGVLETVTEKTGCFFSEQTSDSLKKKVLEFEKNLVFSEINCRKQAMRFSKKRFQKDFTDLIDTLPL